MCHKINYFHCHCHCHCHYKDRLYGLEMIKKIDYMESDYKNRLNER